MRTVAGIGAWMEVGKISRSKYPWEATGEDTAMATEKTGSLLAITQLILGMKHPVGDLHHLIGMDLSSMNLSRLSVMHIDLIRAVVVLTIKGVLHKGHRIIVFPSFHLSNTRTEASNW